MYLETIKRMGFADSEMQNPHPESRGVRHPRHETLHAKRMGNRGPHLTSTKNTPSLSADAFYQANSVGRDGDRPCYVRVRLFRHVDARAGHAMLRFDALLIARTPAQPGMLQDNAVHARAFCTADLCIWTILLSCFRRSPAGV